MTAVGSKPYVELARARAEVYRFLAGVFGQPPQPALLERAADGSLVAEFEPLNEGRGLDLLRRFREWAPSLADLERVLAVEYTALFVIPGSRKANPHESIYLDPEQRLGGEVSVAVRRFYERAGAEISFGCLHLPDHLSVELEFLGFLCAREREAWEGGRTDILRRCLELQRDFLEGHLTKWIGRVKALSEKAGVELGQPLKFYAQLNEIDPSAVKEFSWDFADGGTSSEQNPSYTYKDEGTYSVTLMVTLKDGKKLRDTITVQVQKECQC